MADAQTRGAAGKTPVGEQRACRTQPLRFQVAGRIEHFLHPRPALRPLVADHHHIARHDLIGKNRRHRVVLAFEHARAPGEFQDAFIHAGGLHDAAVRCDVAVQHRQPAVPAVGMRLVANAAAAAVGIQFRIKHGLRKGDGGDHPAGRRAEEFFHRFVTGQSYIPLRERIAQGRAVYRFGIGVQQAGAIQFAQDRRDAAGAMHVFHVVFGVGRDLAQGRHMARQSIHVPHREIHFRFMRDRQQMQHGIGRAAHRNIQRHRILERVERGDGTRQHAGVVLLVVAPAQLDDHAPGAQKQLLALGMRRHQRAVAGQAEPQRFGQAVHRIGGEHAGAGAAGRAGGTLDRIHFLIAAMTVGGRDHRIHQIQPPGLALPVDLARLHRPARDEYHRNVQAHRRHHHPRRDLVAIGDAHQRIGAMRVDHVFHAVGDQFAAGQRIQHPGVPHRNAVVHRDGVEFLGDTARLLDLARHQLPHVLEMHMAGHELGERIGDRDDRLAEVAFGHAGGAPQGACTGHVAAMRGGTRTVSGHVISSLWLKHTYN